MSQLRPMSFTDGSRVAKLVGRTLLLVALIACANPPTRVDQEPEDAPRTRTDPGVPDSPFPYASPSSVGLVDAEVEALADRVYDWVQRERVVGAEVIIIKDRRIVLHEASGWSDRERRIPLARNSIYRIRSMTKPFTGSATLLLAEDGLLSLDDSVATYIPSFDNERSRAITLRQLLTHTAGFLQGEFPQSFYSYPTLRDAVDAAGQAGPSNTPGSAYAYSDVHSATLGAVAAEVAGMPVEDIIEARILGPLGLSDTHTFCSPEVPWSPRMNSTYRRIGSVWQRYWDATMPQVFPFFRASGGLYTTVFDYAEFLTVWMDRGTYSGGQFLTEASVIEALTPGLDDSYGLHWQIFAEAGSAGALSVFGHGGSDGTFAIAVPENDALALYFTQSRGTDTIGEFTGYALELLRP